MSDPPAIAKPDPEPRAFVLRFRWGYGALREDVVVTVDDVLHQRMSHFTNLEAAFAEIRRALDQPGTTPGQSH